MALPEIESYQEDQGEYDRELEEYQRKEAAYKAALATKASDPKLEEQFAELEALRLKLDSRYQQLSERRDELVNARSTALKKISL